MPDPDLPGPLADLADEWRDNAAVLRQAGFDRMADTYKRHARQMETAEKARRNEQLTVAEAAKESGYSRKRLRALVREGRIPDDRDDRGRILIRRGHLPRKPPESPDEHADLIDAVTS